MTKSVVGTLPADLDQKLSGNLADLADRIWLRSCQKPLAAASGPSIRLLDAFSGCGGMSLGIEEALRALGMSCVSTALDIDDAALGIYQRNRPGSRIKNVDLGRVLRGRLSSSVTKAEAGLKRFVGQVDILAAGPPCQGHSDLNNSTRRKDPRNSLYFRVARLAKLVSPRIVIIENVATVVHDGGSVVSRTVAALRQLAYQVAHTVVDAADIGVPQRRRRHLVLAIKSEAGPLEGGGETIDPQMVLDVIRKKSSQSPRSVAWAIADLADAKPNGLDAPAKLTPASKKRIDWLFDNKEYDLPDSERPECHQDGLHSYRSVYGRLRPKAPAQTITSGFMTMGQGRYVHPTRRRTLTPHEAARIQFFPDYFDWQPEKTKRTHLAQIIGNAVPPKLAFRVALEALR